MCDLKLIFQLTNKINLIIKSLNRALSAQIFLIVINLLALGIFMMFIIAFVVGGGMDSKVSRSGIFEYSAEIMLCHFYILQVTLGGHIIHQKV